MIGKTRGLRPKVDDAVKLGKKFGIKIGKNA